MNIKRKPFKELEHQAELYNKIKEDFKIHNKVAANVATGVGKTLLMEHLIIDNLDKRFLIMTSNTKNLEDHIKDINTYCWKEYNGNIIVPINCTYYLYQSLHKVINKKNKFDFIIFDEYHRLGGDKWGPNAKKLLENNPNAKVLGLTATPIRADGRDMTKELDFHLSVELDLSEAIIEDILPYPDYWEATYSFEDEIAELQYKVEKLGYIKK